MSASVKAFTALLLVVGAGVCADAVADATPIVATPESYSRGPSDDPMASDSLIGRVGLSVSSEQRTTAAPRVTSQRARIVGTEVLAVGADGRPLSELGGVSYRWWLTRGRSDVGVGVGALGRVIAPPPGVVDGGTSLSGTARRDRR